MSTDRNVNENNRGARKGAPERVTVWFVVTPWREDKPKTVAATGMRTARMIRLDSPRPQGIHTSQITGRDLERVAYTELDAVRNYHAGLARKVGYAAENLASLQEQLSDAEALLHATMGRAD